MAYLLWRLFAGASDRSPEELERIASQELAPQLIDAGGLLRYSLILLHDGRIGSLSIYDAKATAQKASLVASDWVRSTGATAGYSLVESFEGPVIYSVRGDADQLKRNIVSIARIYASEATAVDIRKKVFEPVESEITAITGFHRLTVAQSDEDGDVGVFSAFDSAEGANQLAELARLKRSVADSETAAILPTDPKSFEGIILGTYTP